MFTGLVAETGTIESVREIGGKTRLTVAAKEIPAKVKLGDSVAVSGVCLTAVDITPRKISFDLAAETIARTSLARLRPGSEVNLELPAAAGSPLGGHIVQGHVDGVGTLTALELIPGREDWKLEIKIPRELMKYVAWKGSIAIEGISLTVAGVESHRIWIAIIPHTYDATNLHSLTAGDPVNVEVDVLAKYAEKQMEERRAGGRLTVDALLAEGF